MHTKYKTPRIAAIARSRPTSWLALLSLILFSLFTTTLSYAADSVCARVKIEIKQELTLERQAFDATMKINHATDAASLENVNVTINFTDDLGNSVKATSNSNDTTAKFYISSRSGKLYFVGATLQYFVGGDVQTLKEKNSMV